MARRWLLLGVLGLIPPLNGCGDDVDEGSIGVSPVEDAGPTADGRAPDEDAGDPDSGDGAVPPTGDAGTPKTVFADDFEDGDLKDDWEVINVCSGCSAAIESGAFVAKTKSLVAQETAFAHLRTTVPGTPSRIRLSFSATFPSVTITKGSLAIATIDVSQSHFFSLYLRDTDMNDPAPVLEETSATAGTKRHFLANLPPAAVKTRIAIDVDLAGGVANVTWDATKALASEPIDKTPAASDPTIRVGLMYVFGPQDPFEATFDDVLLEYY